MTINEIQTKISEYEIRKKKETYLHQGAVLIRDMQMFQSNLLIHLERQWLPDIEEVGN
jgi:hypothetical protein